jgi:long-chain acyl-CoA synthetase
LKYELRITSTYNISVKKYPYKPAIVTENEIVSYIEWQELVERTAVAFFKEASIHKRVAIFLPNGSLFLQLFAGASAAGWASIVGDIRWKDQEIKERLEQTNPDLIIADDKMKLTFQRFSRRVLYSDEIEKWIHPDLSLPTIRDDTEATFYIGFTSGSTGKPKAFVRSHTSWIESIRCNQVDLGMTDKEHVLIPGSFVNSTFLYGALSTLFLGGTIYLLSKFSPTRFMDNLDQYPITTAYVVPTMIQGLLKEGCKSEKSVSFISTGAKWLPQSKEQMRRHFPSAELYEFYGTSELSYVTVLKSSQQKQYAASVGRPFYNVEICIRGENGPVPVGEEGILYVKSKMLFDGYIDNEEETRKVLQGDWATVYDIAKMDEKGYLYILGRQNDMILYGGTNIYPQEIEEALKKCPGVEEVVVFGIKDGHWGEKAVACIIGNVSIPVLKHYCLETLSAYKIPRIFRKVKNFPYTTGGKISRREIRRMFEQGVLI